MTTEMSKQVAQRLMRDSFKDLLLECENCRFICKTWDEFQIHSKGIDHRHYTEYKKTGNGLMLA